MHTHILIYMCIHTHTHMYILGFPGSARLSGEGNGMTEHIAHWHIQIYINH